MMSDARYEHSLATLDAVMGKKGAIRAARRLNGQLRLRYYQSVTRCPSTSVSTLLG